MTKTSSITIIEPHKGWQPINISELFKYKDLFFFLVLRDIKVLYKQTILGFSWALIRPIFQMLVFTFVFGKMAKINSDGIPYALFNYTALVPWTYFSSSLIASTNSLIANTNMITKIYFPRLVIPLTPVIAKLVDFAIASLIIGVLMIVYHIAPSYKLIYLPILVLLMILTASGIGMWLSALSIQYRDIKHSTQFLATILMYAAPVVWPVSLISTNYGNTIKLIYGIYPMAGVIEGFRSAIIGINPMPWGIIGMGSISAITIFISGAFYFKKMERRFADVA